MRTALETSTAVPAPPLTAPTPPEAGAPPAAPPPLAVAPAAPGLAPPAPEPAAPLAAAAASLAAEEETTAELATGAPARRAGLEERLGARLPVWLGAIALALAGAYLVQYSIERNWLSETVRVALALLFGVGLLGAGEWLRPRAAGIAQALSAAGIADLYAALLAGVRLYDLIPPVVGFGLMAANTAVAVLLALRQGPMPAVLGLVGGFLTPALISTGEPNALGLFTYLVLLETGLVVVTRKRRWPGLAGAALAASLLWVAVWLAGPFETGDGVWLGLFLLGSATLFGGSLLVAGETAGWGSPATARALAFAAAGGSLVALAFVVGVSSYGATEWGLLGLLATGCLALARQRERELFELAPLAAAAGFAVLLVQGFDLEPPGHARFLAALAGYGAVVAGGAYAAHFGARRPGRWAALAAAVTVAHPTLGALSAPELGDALWATVALALAALAVLAALPIARRRATLAEGETALAAAAVAATLLAALALALALERAWLSVAFAIEVPVLLWLRDRLRVPALARLALAAALVAAARLLVNPEVLRYPIGELPVLNLLLFAYGAPAAAFLIAAWRCRRAEDARSATWLEWGAVAFAFVGATLSVWHALAPDQPGAALERAGLAGASLQTAVWLLLGGALLAAARRLPATAFALGGRLIVGAAGLAALLVHAGVENPAWSENPVGALPVVNLLAAAFGIPLVGLVLAAREVERSRAEPLFARAARAAALLLGFVWLTLEVRHLFRGSDLAAGAGSSAEGFAYSAAWVAFGTALLVSGVLSGRKPLRLAALGVMLVAVLKVFLFDAAVLSGLFRVFSFLGLGASLLVLAWLYQRFVFRGEKGP